MVYTLTLNPSIDYYLTLDQLEKGKVNRAHPSFRPGGKGLNISLVLNSLGIPNIALGIVGGQHNEKFLSLLDEYGIDKTKRDFLYLPECEVRTNVKLVQQVHGDTTEINAASTYFTQLEDDFILSKMKPLGENDVLIMGGSVPEFIHSNIYSTIIHKYQHIPCILDTSGDALCDALQSSHPFLIKPNRHELSALTKMPIQTLKDAQKAAKFAIENHGARNILVSLDEGGALLVTENLDTFYCEAQKGNVINTVGCGDSMLAAFVAEFFCGSGDFEMSLKKSVEMGSKCAFSEWLPI